MDECRVMLGLSVEGDNGHARVFLVVCREGKLSKALFLHVLDWMRMSIKNMQTEKS